MQRQSLHESSVQGIIFQHDFLHRIRRVVPDSETLPGGIALDIYPEKFSDGPDIPLYGPEGNCSHAVIQNPGSGGHIFLPVPSDWALRPSLNLFRIRVIRFNGNNFAISGCLNLQTY